MLCFSLSLLILTCCLNLLSQVPQPTGTSPLHFPCTPLGAGGVGGILPYVCATVLYTGREESKRAWAGDAFLRMWAWTLGWCACLRVYPPPPHVRRVVWAARERNKFPSPSFLPPEHPFLLQIIISSCLLPFSLFHSSHLSYSGHDPMKQLQLLYHLTVLLCGYPLCTSLGSSFCGLVYALYNLSFCTVK
jgi:hypothetical protein